MRVRHKKSYYIKTSTIQKDSEGGRKRVYSSEAIEIKAHVYPASSQLDVETYGEKVTDKLKMLYDGTVTSSYIDNKLTFTNGDIVLTQGTGVYIYETDTTNNPDYEIETIQPYSHLLITLTKRNK